MNQFQTYSLAYSQKGRKLIIKLLLVILISLAISNVFGHQQVGAQTSQQSSTLYSQSYLNTVDLNLQYNEIVMEKNTSTVLQLFSGQNYYHFGITGVYWLSSNPSIASVDSLSGRVTALQEGTVEITSYIRDIYGQYISKKARVQVIGDRFNVKLSKNGKLITPPNTDNYISTDSSILSITPSGEFSALRTGVVTIYKISVLGGGVRGITPITVTVYDGWN